MRCAPACKTAPRDRVIRLAYSVSIKHRVPPDEGVGSPREVETSGLVPGRPHPGLRLSLARISTSDLHRR